MFRQAFLSGILAVILYIIFHFYAKMQFNYHYKKHYPGECRQVTGLDFGAEDIGVTQDGLVFVTSGMDFPQASDAYHEFVAKNAPGKMFLLDFKRPQLGARPLKFKSSKTFDPETFQPHGMDLLEDRVKGEHLLYVVNHVKHGKDRVEKFRYKPGVNELEHVRFFNSSTFFVLNDVSLVGEDRFYASNYLYFEMTFFSFLEHWLHIPLGGLLYVDGDDVTEVVTSLHGANGVILSKDKRFLYLSVSLDNIVHVYERQKDNGLTLVQEVCDLHSSIDNLQLSQTEDALLAGAHPIKHKIMAHWSDPANQRSPSSVLHLPLSSGLIDTEKITELFYDHGDLISGLSVAHIHSGQLLIGSVIDKLMLCDLYGKVTCEDGMMN